VFIGVVNSPYSRTRPNIKYTLYFRIRVIWWSKAEFVIKSEKEEIVLEICEKVSL